MELPPDCNDVRIMHVGHARNADVPDICTYSNHLRMRSIHVSGVPCMRMFPCEFCHIGTSMTKIY